ncbi:Major intrinsic protein [Musa troglodytarum]|uniref:Major intrinsic protein n=1 Tax=Musa troglodytarum TaxID=320322 RepID=A0A9E7F818_9LILI|nr:Major intrinsic protein [Musa troglodytarum]
MTAALDSSSSSCVGFCDDDDDGNASPIAAADHLAARSAESSASARRYSRIFSRWVARQAEEMIINIERRNRESELMGLAGLHLVSMLDPSFLRESGRSPLATSNVERPVGARASSILQMWRELEDMTSAARTERRTTVAASADGRNHLGRLELSGGSVSVSESDYNGYDQWTRRNIDSLQRPGEIDADDLRSSREQSPDPGEDATERVRQIVRGELGIAEMESRVSPRNHTQRAQWLGEIARERVRLVRESVQMTSRQRSDARASRREEREREGSDTDHEDGQTEHVRRESLRRRGRQARLELTMRTAAERQRELQILCEHRAVSEFAHRSRIQSLLRGRFLRNGVVVQDDQERPPSAAERELGQLRQHRHVSALREGLHFQLENTVWGQSASQPESSADQSISAADQSQAGIGTELPGYNHEEVLHRIRDSDVHQTTGREETPELESGSHNDTPGMQQYAAAEVAGQRNEDARHESRDREPNTNGGFGVRHEEVREDFNGNWQENVDQDWPHETAGYDVGEESHLPQVHEEWHGDEPADAEETWPDEHTDPLMDQTSSSPPRRGNRFIPPDDEAVYSVELRELLSRRSVSNLLRSTFRESLEQLLIQSYTEQQGRVAFDWDLYRPLAAPILEDTEDQRQDDSDQAIQDSTAGWSNVFRPPPVPPPPPPPPPLWHSNLHHDNWEGDAINDLRVEMAALRQGMSGMQRMLEACMDMQIELQRAVRQEVSAALNRSAGEGFIKGSFEDGSKWSQARKGTCCVCCDNHIDSLLYRCGHMCSCSKCAQELLGRGGRCPLCRAPIVEVVRVYSVL